MKQDEKSLSDKILPFIKKFIKDNGIKIVNFDLKTPEIEKYFINIIEFLKDNKQELKKFMSKFCIIY